MGSILAVMVTNPRLDELFNVFHFLFSRCTNVEREERVSHALELVETSELDPEGIFIVRDGRQLAGVIVALPLAGAGAVFWAPMIKKVRNQADIENQLMQAALHWLRKRGVKVAHALLNSEDARADGIFLRNGFAHVTRMQYLQALVRPFDPPPLSIRTYAEVDAGLFQRTIEQTYEGTLDCPELTGVRTMDEVIEGHQAQGEFDPGRWWLAHHAGAAAGVLLLADMPAWRSWDISYLGVTSGARRCGIARQMIQLAFNAAHSAGVSELTVAVDVRNEPAWKLYASLGFQPGEQREVYLNVF